ncbi:hypothetical protein EJ08DRAFT_587752 [Tothia fuscella]|uniref:Quinate repressor protein n=1 Tax=Tothia fuscella TaxID=1048955 RepID=A0A9P4TZ25_9PEZI|nr:hypothetical protein EJ08DRAFT_587752 [Tothia fuscella]
MSNCTRLGNEIICGWINHSHTILCLFSELCQYSILAQKTALTIAEFLRNTKWHSASSSIRTASRTFDSEATIVLVGASGTGKTTLGVIASTALQRRLIDADFSFKEITGESTTAFRKEHGASNYRQRSIEILKTVLHNNKKHCVIVCGLISLSTEGQEVLSEYCQTHPVIHTLRDLKHVQSYLRMDKERTSKLLEAAARMFRLCSNLEFFNLSDLATSTPNQETTLTLVGSDETSSTPYLALKRTERHFLKFLSSATTIANLPALEDAYPLSRVRTDARSFTYAISIPFSQLASVAFDFERLEEGADAFEMTIDLVGLVVHNLMKGSCDLPYLNSLSETFARIRRTTVVPLIYHVERKRHDPSKEGVSARLPTYIDLVNHGLRLAPEFLTLDLSLSDEEISEVMRVKGSTRLIAHCFSSDLQLSSWNHEFWTSAYERARKLEFDAVRLCWPATCLNDNFGVHKFRANISQCGDPPLPLIAYNTGPLGKTSCCFNRTLTPVTHEDVPVLDSQLHPPLSTAAEATRALYASFIFEPMHFYIVGASAGYSLSPAMHNAAYRVCGIPHTYGVHVTPTLAEIHKLVDDPHFGGCSVSQPYKREVMALTRSMSPHAKAIGAVNTLIPVRHLLEDGSVPDELELFQERNRSGPVKALYGENSDWIGVRSCVRRGLSPANAVTPRTTALIIGAGGMARAAIYAALNLGVRNIFIYNRTSENAEKVVEHFRQLVKDEISGQASLKILPPSIDSNTHLQVITSKEEPWPEKFHQPTIVVSCIPTHRLGENPSPDFTLPPHWLRSPTGGVVLEVAYRNIHTPLLEQIRAESHRGWVAMDGLDLLPDQGFAQFELFTGRRAPRKLMRAEVLRSYRDEQGLPDDVLIHDRLEKIIYQEP